ncbi:MAG: 2,3-bisphosphoglycerate-independent phosphoglycerate mutase [Planctomycetota bacterium]
MELIASLAQPADTKILLLVLDGLGGLPGADGRSELERARIPNLDRFAADAITGLHEPVAPGVTPGSGPGHLALFGYDPLAHMIDRGPLGAAGLGILMGDDDVAARVNFCTLDAKGNVADRRAGRIATEKTVALIEKIGERSFEGVRVRLTAERDYRAVAIFTGPGLAAAVTDSDPQATGVAPLTVGAKDAASKKLARVANAFATDVRKALADEPTANGLLMRGFSRRPEIPSLSSLYHLRPAAIAHYPMYRGVAYFAGMKVLEPDGIRSWDDELAVLERSWKEFDFFFLHFKPTDSAGEDGNVEKRVQCLETADAAIPRLRALGPDVFVITGDHSTPCGLKSHSWHPVPVALVSATARRDSVRAFSETAFATGALGRFPGPQLMGLMLAHARRLEKYGA